MMVLGKPGAGDNRLAGGQGYAKPSELGIIELAHIDVVDHIVGIEAHGIVGAGEDDPRHQRQRHTAGGS